jgi:prevent-host-death family protein
LLSCGPERAMRRKGGERGGAGSGGAGTGRGVGSDAGRPVELHARRDEAGSEPRQVHLPGGSAPPGQEGKEHGPVEKTDPDRDRDGDGGAFVPPACQEVPEEPEHHAAGADVGGPGPAQEPQSGSLGEHHEEAQFNELVCSPKRDQSAEDGQRDGVDEEVGERRVDERVQQDSEEAEDGSGSHAEADEPMAEEGVEQVCQVEGDQQRRNALGGLVESASEALYLVAEGGLAGRGGRFSPFCHADASEFEGSRAHASNHDNGRWRRRFNGRRRGCVVGACWGPAVSRGGARGGSGRPASQRTWLGPRASRSVAVRLAGSGVDIGAHWRTLEMYLLGTGAMDTVSMREARKRLSELVRAAERGESVTITRRGKEVARLVPAAGKALGSMPDLSGFRASIRVKGRSLSQTVIDMRAEERY